MLTNANYFEIKNYESKKINANFLNIGGLLWKDFILIQIMKQIEKYLLK